MIVNQRIWTGNETKDIYSTFTLSIYKEVSSGTTFWGSCDGWFAFATILLLVVRWPGIHCVVILSVNTHSGQ